MRWQTLDELHDVVKIYERKGFPWLCQSNRMFQTIFEILSGTGQRAITQQEELRSHINTMRGLV